MRFWLGKALELAGIGMLPVAIYHGETASRGAFLEELALMALGGAIFTAGWMLERSSNR